MTFLPTRPFKGTSMRDVLQYLQVDVSKGFANLYGILGKVKLQELFEVSSVGAMVSFGSSATPEDITALTLDAGEWNVFGSAQFSVNGATGTIYGQAWLGREPASPNGTVYGYSRAETRLVASVAPWFQVTCFRRVVLPARQTVYLGSLASYTGGPVQRLGSIWAIGRG